MNNLTDTQKQLLNLLSVALFNREREEAEYNWDQLKQEALDQTVFSLVYPVVKDLLPDDKKAEWESLNARIIAKNLMVDYEHAELHELMTENNIPYVVLKGFSSAYYYPDPMLRMMGDVDFLVAEEDVERAGKALESIGFQREKHEHCAHHNGYHRGNSSWELHYSMGGIPEGKCGDRIKDYMSHFIEHSLFAESNDISCNLPSEFDHALIMLVHVAKHITDGGGVGLRHLCDWAVFANKIDISKYKTQLEEIGLWTFCCQLTSVSASYLGLNAMSCSQSITNDFVDWFIEDIYTGGNFGRKEDNRGSAYRVVEKGNIFHSLAARAKAYYPFCQEKSYLIPIGMIMFAVGFVYRRLSGQKKWVTYSEIVDGRKRKRIYEQFCLYEV